MEIRSLRGFFPGFVARCADFVGVWSIQEADSLFSTGEWGITILRFNEGPKVFIVQVPKLSPNTFKLRKDYSFSNGFADFVLSVKAE